MTTRIAVVAAWGLALLLGVPAFAQSGNKAGESKGQQGDSQKSKDSGQSQSQTETIRGELAAVSVLGETMVDYSSGRGAIAEFTYLTILGSNSHDKTSATGGKAESGDDAKKGSQDQASSGSKTNESANKDQGHSGSASEGHRRIVYQIAVGPETHVRFGGSQGGQGSDDQKGDKKGSTHQESQASLERLQLGDRVEVKFTRMKAQGGQSGDDQKGSSNQARHGRHRIVRGMAQTITILSTPHQGSNTSSGGGQTGSGSQDKKSG